MKSVKQHSALSRLAISSLAFLLFFSLNLSAQEGDAANGEKLFKSVCAACHKLDKISRPCFERDYGKEIKNG